MRVKLLFSLRDGNLILQARRPEGSDPRILQLVPRTVITHDFPKPFVDDCVHWLDIGTGEVEFRPVESPWTPDPSNWRLTVHTANSSSSLRKISASGAGPVDLVDIRSSTFRMISGLLSALESAETMIITCTNETAEASLSRLRLEFFVNQDLELECRSIPGYVMDELQSCGTMFGLKNKLVLRRSSRCSEMPRRVLIPQGDIKFSLNGDFVDVSINTGKARHAHWHEYTIDADLRRLTGNVSLQSKLHQCYLHALTSHCLPDPLIGHTGTEEALNMLQSAAFLSFQRLSKDDAKLLEMISDLTPSRAYHRSYSWPYSDEPAVVVGWKGLPALSQHHDFYPAVLSIVGHANNMEALYNEPNVFQIPSRCASLLIRAASRNKAYYPQDLLSLRRSSSIPNDVVYKSRDIANGQHAEHAAYRMSWSVLNDRPCLPRKWRNLWKALQSWKSLGPVRNTISLRYSRYWLTFDPEYDWLGIYRTCQETLNRDPRETKTMLAFSLSAACFRESGRRSDDTDIVPLILIFATDTRFRDIVPPSISSGYNFSDGTYPEHKQVAQLMSRYALPRSKTPAHTMEVRGRARKSESGVKKTRERKYNKTIKKLVSKAARSTVKRWPDRSCDLPDQWFNAQSCRRRVLSYLESISKNITLRGHILRLEAILGNYGTRTPPEVLYVFSPRYGVRPHRPSLPSLTDILVSLSMFPPPPNSKPPLPGCAIPSTVVTTAEDKDNPLSTRGDGLRSLIQEFVHSQESLLRIYGEDLNKSYNDLLGRAPFPVRRAVPPQQDLRLYRDLCSQEKDAIFSELSEAIAPSGKQEHVVSIAGLWP